MWFFGHLNRWQIVCVAIDPIRNGLRTNFQDSADRALAASFHIHSQRQHALFWRISLWLWFGRVDPITFSATIPLTFWSIQSCFILFLVCVASWTFHTPYSIMFSLLDTPAFHLSTQPLWRCVIIIAFTITRCLKVLRSAEKARWAGFKAWRFIWWSMIAAKSWLARSHLGMWMTANLFLICAIRLFGKLIADRG